MKNHDKKIAEELKQRLYSIDIPIVDFRVFGSRAREDASEFSDMNIFIEVEDLSKELNMKILDAVWEVLIEHSIYISPIIFTRTEIEESDLDGSPIIANIYQEGVKV